jgi:hypothetical protein
MENFQHSGLKMSAQSKSSQKTDIKKTVSGDVSKTKKCDGNDEYGGNGEDGLGIRQENG